MKYMTSLDQEVEEIEPTTTNNVAHSERKKLIEKYISLRNTTRVITSTIGAAMGAGVGSGLSYIIDSSQIKTQIVPAAVGYNNVVNNEVHTLTSDAEMALYIFGTLLATGIGAGIGYLSSKPITNKIRNKMGIKKR